MDPGLSRKFLNLMPESWFLKGKNDKLNFLKTRNFCSMKDPVKRMKIQSIDQEKYLKAIALTEDLRLKDIKNSQNSKLRKCFFVFCFCFCFCLFVFSRAAPMAYGGSQARGLIGAAAAGLHHSHSNRGSESHLRPTPQLVATPDPYSTERGQGSNPQPHDS